MKLDMEIDHIITYPMIHPVSIQFTVVLQKMSIKFSKRTTCRHGVWVVNAFTTHRVVGVISDCKYIITGTKEVTSLCSLYP